MRAVLGWSRSWRAALILFVEQPQAEFVGYVKVSVVDGLASPLSVASAGECRDFAASGSERVCEILSSHGGSSTVTNRRWWLLAAAAAVLASGCTGGPDEPQTTQESENTSVETVAFDPTVVVLRQEATVRDRVVGPSPDSDDVPYFCKEQPIATLDELAAFETLPSPPQSRLDSDPNKPLGLAAGWVQFESGFIADRLLLNTSPPTLVIVPPETNWAEACIPTRATDRRPVAWRSATEPANGRVTVEVEPCWNPEDIIADVRSDGNQALVALYASGVPEGSCVVDGSVTIDLEIPDSASEVLSSQFWPFASADPAVFWTLEPATAAVAATDDVWAAIECDVRSDLDLVRFLMFDVPPGGEVSVEINDQPWLSGLRVEPLNEVRRIAHNELTDRLVSYGDLAMGVNVGFPHQQQTTQYFEDASAGQVISFNMTVTIDDKQESYSCGQGEILDRPTMQECTMSVVGGVPQFATSPWRTPPQLTLLRDGQPVPPTSTSGPAIDLFPIPGATHRYSIQSTEADSEPIECGTTPIEWITPDVTQLEAARTIFQRLTVGPYVYADLEGPDEIDRLIMEFETEGYGFIEPATGGSAYDPTTLHDRLIAAINRGSDVRYLLDVTSGFPVRWSIDGQDYGMSCLRFETSPPDIFGQDCGDRTTDLIGQPR